MSLASGFSFLCLERHTVISQLFQLAVSEMVVVAVAWCSAFLLEEERRGDCITRMVQRGRQFRAGSL